ncbi:restriction endonuclease subunit S [Bacillus safensis]|uniref:restriction endonuclease subunit S n=1 Tax=Bacillus safensis TaxID=561879 RepID=UPI0024819C0C|nr:restriction endonuclease subunit S [Bacillus safensis]MDI0191767.1 restriction endonuclease subunit S [Bacillus safensis]
MTVVLKKSKLKYHLKVKNGREVTNEVNYGKNVIDVYGSGGVFKYTDKKLFTGPSVLFGRKGTIGKPLYVEGDFWAVDTMYYTEVYSGNSPRYFYYLLEVFPWGKIVTQTALPSIVGSELENYEVNIPSEEVQKIIAKFLDRKCVEIETLLKHKERLLILLEQQRQSIITESVTKGLNANVKMKDSGVEWIGEVPEHWDEKALKYCFKIGNGKEIENEIDKEEDGIVVYGSGGVFKKTDKVLYNGESVLFGRKGTIGKPLYINGAFWTVDTMYYTKFSTNSSPKWFYYLLLIYPWDLIVTQTALPSVVGSDVANTICAIPPLEEQKQIADYLSKEDKKFFDLKSSIEQQIEKLKEYRQSLIYEAVTGKIDVRDMELDEVR